MDQGVFISRTDFNQLMKKVDAIQDFILSSIRARPHAKWVTARIAMEMIGCKGRKLQQLRVTGKLIWKTSGKGRNIQVERASIEKYISENSNSNT